MYTEVWIKNRKTHEHYRLTLPGLVTQKEVCKMLKLCKCEYIMSVLWEHGIEPDKKSG